VAAQHARRAGGGRAQALRISAVERIVVLAVVAAVLAFEVWFFFFAGSSLPSP